MIIKHRNTKSLLKESYNAYQLAVDQNLMQVTIRDRKNKIVTLLNGNEVIEFINCSYLGIDLHPAVLNANKNLNNKWGVNFCCARSRFSIEPQMILEDEISILFRGHAITFPSVTTTHLSVMPLIASGVLIDSINPPKVKMIFDKLAHSSMQFIKPILAAESRIETISHNNLNELRESVIDAKKNGEVAVYVADGVYSMGGLCPINELLKMADELNFYIYVDDAHGTSIFGDDGEGSVMSRIKGQIPQNLFITFALSKGFGCNGGGVLVPDKKMESLVRTFGQIYAFSAALDFSIVNACLASIDLHRNGTVKMLQHKLHRNVALFDELLGLKNDFSPIRMITIGDSSDAIRLAKNILANGFFISVVFFPIVPKNQAQLRICIAANHTEEQIQNLVKIINKERNNLWK